MTKVLLMLSVVGFTIELEISEEDINRSPCGRSFLPFSPSDAATPSSSTLLHFLHALRALQALLVCSCMPTAQKRLCDLEKTRPSPLSMMGDLKAAMEWERRMNPRGRATQKDCCGRWLETTTG